MGGVLALDPGGRRIGLAGSDPLGITAQPLGFVEAAPPEAAVRRIAAAAAERGASTVVIGLPLNMNGSEGPAARRARALGQTLRPALPAEAEIVFWDERLTSRQAEASLLAEGVSHRRRKERVDARSAALLLASYLEARQRGEARREPPPLPPAAPPTA